MKFKNWQELTSERKARDRANTRYLSFVFSLSIFFSFCEELREAKGFCRDEGFDSSILKFNQKESLTICLLTVCLTVGIVLLRSRAWAGK